MLSLTIGTLIYIIKEGTYFKIVFQIFKVRVILDFYRALCKNEREHVSFDVDPARSSASTA